MAVNKVRVLVVDGDPLMRSAAKAVLREQGCEVEESKSSREALPLIRNNEYDLIILDSDLPGASTIETCREIRQGGSDAAIIIMFRGNNGFTTASALEAGADFCIRRPFEMEDLLARVRLALRGMGLPPFFGLTRVCLGDLEIDFKARRVLVKSSETRLTPREFDILAYLATHPNKTVTHRELIRAVWDSEYGDKRKSLRTLVHRLRRKIDPLQNRPQIISTQAWVGYRMDIPEKGSNMS